MNTTIVWQILLILALLSEAAADATVRDFFVECPIAHCREGEPEIRYPFRNVIQQSICGVPGFEIRCNEDNRTVINLPYEGDFYVKSIDYRSNYLQISDPQGCLINRTIIPFNLSSSPFRPNGEIPHYLLFNCSSADASSMDGFFLVNCLSTFESAHIYAAKSYDLLFAEPPFCDRLDTTAILDYPNSDYLTYLTLTWELPFDCSSCKGGQLCGRNLTTNATACLKPSHQGGLSSGAIVGIMATIVLSAILAVSLYYWDHKFGGYWELDQNEVEKFLGNYQSLKPNRYSYSDLKKMTNHFREKLGEGGFGSVYRGRLPNGLPVAVKTLETSKSNGDEFINEVATIGRVHHVNVVRLLGFCAERFKRALVYEFMPNGSLEKFIFSSESKPCDLGWGKLHEIAVGVARGIEYLHQGCDQRILHFDIKPHNILLDHKFTPKISDFGLAKFCSKDQSIVSMAAARGTAGYIAPEVVSRNFGNVSYKSDVYSFGMLLLEMVGKRKNIDVNVEHTSQVYFPEWIYNRVNMQQELGAGVVVAEEEDEIARKLVIVALWCIQLKPADRPNMKKVVQMLEGATEMLETPPNPFVSNTT
ncbi:Glycerophosphodiester phosphodiesterase protein kinase domain-containing [Nymphaea thermarum]|nr:Glycerophosphodiester phosphodiesterase protein kinase domain-containing [Nymphaea thermarum]